MPEEEQEAVRRRLYAPGATAADVARYRALAPSVVGSGAVGPVAPTGRRRPARVVPALVGLALVVLAVVVAALVAPPTSRSTAPSGGTSSPVAAAPAAETLRVPADARARFAAALEAGDGADLRRYLYEHPGARPAQLTTLTRADTAEYHGAGPQAVELDPSSIADGGGRLTLILLVARTSDATWTLTRQAVRTDHRAYRQVVAVRVLHLPAGVARSVTLAYTAPAPARVAVDVPADVRWDLVAVYSD